MDIKLTELDKNFKQESTLSLPDLVYHHYLNGKFTISGADHYSEKAKCLVRLPQEVIEKVREEAGNVGVYNLAHCPAGVRIRFKTNSPYIAIKSVCKSPASRFFSYDLYQRIGNTFKHVKNLSGEHNATNFESFVNVSGGSINEYEIQLPILASIKDIFIGLKEGSVIEPPSEYLIKKPIVFYGHSITHGGSASRPGNSYTAIIPRRLCADYINLGFAGNAKGEAAMAEYIASLDMSVFVMDYDHNAPTVEHLENTHERFFKIVREKNPNLPIIMITKSNVLFNLPSDAMRKAVVFKTYLNAKKSGDENVYFIDGSTFLLSEYADTHIVDQCHPSDTGFLRFAEVIGSVVKSVIKYE